VSRLLSAVAAGVLIWPAASLTYAAELDPLMLLNSTRSNWK
jgi:hypothetical protein